MSTALADPRTEQVHAAADNVEHLYCWQCDPEGTTLFCGMDGSDQEQCPNGFDCTEHPECPICRMLDDEHECPESY